MTFPDPAPPHADHVALAEQLARLRERQTAMLDQIAELRVRLERSERLLDAVGGLWAEMAAQRARSDADLEAWLPLEETFALIDTATSIEEAARFLGRRAFGPDGCDAVLVACCDGPGSMRLVAHEGVDRHLVQAFMSLDLEERLPTTDAVRSGHPVFARDEHDLRLRYAHIPIGQGRVSSAAALPIAQADQRIGSVTFWFPHPQTFDVGARRHLAAIAGRLAPLLSRAQTGA